MSKQCTDIEDCLYYAQQFYDDIENENYELEQKLLDAYKRIEELEDKLSEI